MPALGSSKKITYKTKTLEAINLRMDEHYADLATPSLHWLCHKIFIWE